MIQQRLPRGASLRGSSRTSRGPLAGGREVELAVTRRTLARDEDLAAGVLPEPLGDARRPGGGMRSRSISPSSTYATCKLPVFVLWKPLSAQRRARGSGMALERAADGIAARAYQGLMKGWARWRWRHSRAGRSSRRRRALDVRRGGIRLSRLACARGNRADAAALRSRVHEPLEPTKPTPAALPLYFERPAVRARIAPRRSRRSASRAWWLSRG